MKKLVYLIVFLVLNIAAVSIGAVVFWLKVPADGAVHPIEFEAKEGASVGEVANALAKAGVLRWPTLFKFYARYQGQANKIKAGPYVFEAGILPPQILEKLTKGEVSLVQFTIPEGWNMYQIAGKLSGVFPHVKKEIWLQEMRNPRYRVGLPREAQNLEGYLFPETYSIRTKASAQDVVQLLVSTFSKHFDSKIVELGAARGLTPHQIVTLASIIEKETGVPEERPRISSVFHNRLAKRMRLQTDPTVIYGIWERYDGNIRKRDLLESTPYNTYLIDGLPPGPIACPGRRALEAAVEPLTTDDLYFVGKQDGTHVFAKSLSEHNKNVYQYQILPFRKARGRASK